MIKINLLGVVKAKKARKADQAKVQVFLGILSLVLMGALAAGGWIWLENRINSLTEQKSKRDKELAALKDQVKEVENLEATKKMLEDKIAIIENLKKNQSGPVVLLDELSRALPSRVWITALSEQKGKIDLDGKASTNVELVEFIETMAKSGHFTDIQLVESRAGIEGVNAFFSFKLKLNFTS